MKLTKEQADNLVRKSILNVAEKLASKYDKPINLCTLAIIETNKHLKNLSALDVIMSMQKIDLALLNDLEAKIKNRSAS